MEALVHLRYATLSDLVVNGGELIPNRVYFERSIRTGRLEGPYEIEAGITWPRDIIASILYKGIMVPHFEAVPDGLSCTMLFRTATAADLKEGDDLKFNFIYYLLLEDVLHGPFCLVHNSNKNDLNVYLKRRAIYVLEHRSLQGFMEINHTKKAS